MKYKTRILVLILGLILISMPVYAVGYEGIKTWGQFILTIVIFIAVIFLAIIGTRIIATNYKGFKNDRYVEIYDSTDLPGGSKVVIIKINEVYYVLSINNGQTTVIDKIKAEDFIEKDFSESSSDEIYNYNTKLYKQVNNLAEKFSKVKYKEGKEKNNEK